MPDWKYLLQLPLYAVFIAFIGYFSVAPAYEHVAPELAQIKIAFSHPAERVEACHERTPEELAKLAPNMRRPMDCSRERLPLLVELEMDGELVYRGEEPPTGLWNDGPATVYRKFLVPAGDHQLVARLRDSRDTTGFDYEQDVTVSLVPGQNLVIGFRATTNGFSFQ